MNVLDRALVAILDEHGLPKKIHQCIIKRIENSGDFVEVLIESENQSKSKATSTVRGVFQEICKITQHSYHPVVFKEKQCLIAALNNKADTVMLNACNNHAKAKAFLEENK